MKQWEKYNVRMKGQSHTFCPKESLSGKKIKMLSKQIIIMQTKWKGTPQQNSVMVAFL